MKTAKLPSKEYLDECLDYNPETGCFTWKVRPVEHFKTIGSFKMWNKRYSCKEAGRVKTNQNGKSYRTIIIDGVSHYSHRIAMVFYCGFDSSSSMQIDHIDGNGLNNAINNLRIVTPEENSKNLRKASDNKSGATGVWFSSRDSKWIAEIKTKGKKIHIGSFNNQESAIEARRLTESKLGFHKNHGTERPL
jgi:hypothetical protein